MIIFNNSIIMTSNTNTHLQNHLFEIGKSIYNETKTISFSQDEDSVFPTPSSRTETKARTCVDNGSMYAILHVAYQSGNYYLILTKFKEKYYRVFYTRPDENGVLKCEY